MTETASTNVTQIASSESFALYACSHCQQCGYNNFPPTTLCPGCLSEQVHKKPLSLCGTLYSWTTTRVGADVAFVGYVDLPERVRVFGKVTPPPDAQRPHCGMAVELVEIRNCSP